MFKVYLAGPIASQDLAGATEWRHEAQQRLADLDIRGYSPLRSKEHLIPQSGRIGSSVVDYKDDPLTSQSGITIRDRYDVMSSDVMIANLLGATEKLVGTAVEFGWADAFNIPVIMVIEPEGSILEHPILNHIAGFRVSTVEEACLVAARILYN